MSYQPMLHKRVRDLIVGACDVLLFIGETLNVTEESGKARATSNGSYSQPWVGRGNLGRAEIASGHSGPGS